MAKGLRILIDADAFVALVKENDSNHKKAVSTLQKIENDLIFTTPFTIPETVTVISHKMTQREAKEFLISIRNKNFTEAVLNTETVNNTDKIFLAQKVNGTSWVDCLNVAVIKIAKLNGIFSFDKFYKRLGVRTFPA
ncbi:MAG: hypothetical protein UV54_C0039G0010 [Candidatus Beckwithbacteria bacterium GW2011_GWA2_43_10]|uniref:PIN domain-containing protein n=1 Tax=Candidatus Beckwithbacteria bacterium GW2011_GWA2_43_10 TaxID=1618369 RepID=A0A0G1E870_9BACT|nr:MAG: hypothetical protein UV54_C0039G0010 [Candidatus Beckwithbacteria bacterium GW2011_GWA2_43_10]